MALFLAQRASHPALGDCLGVDLEMPFQLLGGLLGWCCRREEVENSPGLFPPSAREGRAALHTFHCQGWAQDLLPAQGQELLFCVHPGRKAVD